MNCPHCNSDKHATKAGLWHTRQGIIQKYYCKHCNKYFTDKTQLHTQYPLQVILCTLQCYNQGYPIQKAKTLTGKKYWYSSPLLQVPQKHCYRPAPTTIKIRFSNFPNHTPKKIPRIVCFSFPKSHA